MIKYPLISFPRLSAWWIQRKWKKELHRLQDLAKKNDWERDKILAEFKRNALRRDLALKGIGKRELW